MTVCACVRTRVCIKRLCVVRLCGVSVRVCVCRLCGACMCVCRCVYVCVRACVYVSVRACVYAYKATVSGATVRCVCVCLCVCVCGCIVWCDCVRVCAYVRVCIKRLCVVQLCGVSVRVCKCVYVVRWLTWLGNGHVPYRNDDDCCSSAGNQHASVGAAESRKPNARSFGKASSIAQFINTGTFANHTRPSSLAQVIKNANPLCAQYESLFFFFGKHRASAWRFDENQNKKPTRMHNPLAKLQHTRFNLAQGNTE